MVRLYTAFPLMEVKGLVLGELASPTQGCNTLSVGAGTSHRFPMNPGENVYNTLDVNMGRPTATEGRTGESLRRKINW